MDDIYKVYLHNPPHYFVSNAMYMVTGAIVHKQPLLSEDRRKEFFLKTLFEKTTLFGWDMEAWAVLNNHYHRFIPLLLFKSTVGITHQAGRSGKIIGIHASPMKNRIWQGCIIFT